MSEPSIAEKAQNEHDTTLDIPSHPHSPSQHHRPDHDRPHHHHESHPPSGGHHHGESHHHREAHQEFHDSGLPHPHHSKAHPQDKVHHPTSFGWGHSSATIHPHHSYHEDYSDDEHHHGSRTHYGMSHHHREAYHHTGPHHSGPHHHAEADHHGGPYHHTESDHHGGPHHGGPYHHAESDHHGGPHHHPESDHHGGPHHHGRHHYYGGHPHPQTSGMSYQHSETSYSSRQNLPGASHHGEYGHPGEFHSKSPSYHREDSYRYGDPYHHSEDYHQRGSQHREPHQYNKLHPHDYHHHRKYPHHQDSILSHPSGESYHHGSPHFHREYYHGGHHPSEDHHDEHYHHRDHHHGEQHHAEPHHGEHHHHRDYHHGEQYHVGPHHRDHHHHHGEHHHHREHHHLEYHHSSAQYDHLHRDSYKDYHTSGSHLFEPHKPHSIVGSAAHLESTKSLPHGVIQSHTTVYSRASQASDKIHPQDSSSKDSKSWSEDEQYQRQKKARGQRTHKKYTMNIFQRFCERLKTLLWRPWTIIRNLTQSSVFETFIFLVVFLNIFMLMAQTFAEVKIRGEWYFMAFDCIFLSIYMIEALLKIISLGLEYFYDPWNNLDFFVMIMAVLDFALMQVNSLYSFYNHSLFRILKVLKIMRALRAIRIVRRLRILTSLKEVTGTLVGSLQSIITIFILIFSCLLFFSMILTLFRRSDPWRFENFFTTMFTLFTVLTLDDWSLIYMDSRAQGAWYIIPILMIYIFIQNIIFLNLLTAVLVDNFQMALLRDEEKVKQEMTAWIHEKLLDDSLTELNQIEPEEPKEVKPEDTMELMKKSGTMTEKQWELQSQFLKLVARLEHHRQKFSSGARVIDEVVDTTFEVNQKTSRRDPRELHMV
uniref:Cation channel sperm-associated protein 1 n=2 Tax=Chinchilla lanigera TaxID=34839 RepID=A0A8C2VZS0_CHILA